MQRMGVPHSSSTSGGPDTMTQPMTLTEHVSTSDRGPTHGAVVTEPLPQGLVDAPADALERHEQEAHWDWSGNMNHFVTTVTFTPHWLPSSARLVFQERERKVSLNIQVKPCLGPVPTDWSNVWQLSILTQQVFQKYQYFQNSHFYL